MSRPSNQIDITRASVAYRGSCGESHTACQHRFLPAFRDNEDGRVELAKLANGSVAPMHLISNLPNAWATQVDANGHVLQLKASVEAGFVKGGRFYTRDEAASADTE